MPVNQLNLRTQNYLVPASGTTNSYSFVGVFDPSAPISYNWNQNSLDGQVFIPSGVFIDNSQGTDVLTVIINELNYSIICPAGRTISKMYPAPLDQSVTITGTGQASVVFVDFPVIPCNF